MSFSMWQHWRNTFCHVTCLGFLLPLNASHGYVVYQVCSLYLINSLLQWFTEEEKALSGVDLNSSRVSCRKTRASVPKANVP